MTNPFFTIGHSTRSIKEFVELLRLSQVQMVVDVRTIPRSRTNPQFNRDTVSDALAEFQIGYEHISELGGLRGKQATAGSSANGFWQNKSFRNYADYTTTDGFKIGLKRLRVLGTQQRLVLMCAEAVWWRCHRRIIADHLLVAHQEVFHILGKCHVDPAKLTPGGVIVGDGSLLYPGGNEGT